MQKIIYTNKRGQSVEIGNNEPYLLNSIEGLGEVEANNQSQKAPYQDGSTPTDTLLEERVIPFTLTIKASSAEDLMALRQKLSSVFNPKMGEGTLIYEDDYQIKMIKGKADSIPTFPSGISNRTPVTQKSSISLTCSNPYWLTEEKVDQLVVWEGGLKFPITFPTYFARRSDKKSKILLNDGGVETPIKITFNGPATAPIRIENKTTGEFIEVNQSLQAGERLEINTAFGQKRVTKVLADGTQLNAFHYLKMPGSSFFGLEVGNNLIDYSIGADYERAGVTVTWRNRFVGI